MAKVVKPFTKAEFNKWLEDQRGWGSELEADGICDAEDAVYDVVQSYMSGFDDTGLRAAAYLKQQGCQDVTGALADYLYDVAYDK